MPTKRAEASTPPPEPPSEPTPPEIPEPPDPTNVITAIARVMAEIGGIKKLTSAERQRRGMSGGDGGLAYAFRGIDQLAQAAQPLFGRYGVVMVPTVLDTTVTDILVKGNPWTDTAIEVRYDIYGPGGVTDRIESVVTGLGRDNSDKGVNKAMTGAFKNLLLRILCVGDPQDDTDGHTNEADNREPIDARPEPAASDVMFDRIKAVAAEHPSIGVELKQWSDGLGKKVNGSALRDEAWRNEVGEKLDLLVAALGQSEAEGPTRTVEEVSEQLAADLGATDAPEGVLPGDGPTGVDSTH